ncbi:AfsR/SARP family transcriptional regulator [Actinophytocola xanthii]|uniref:OmpR/PhoB-type domain-containing protein n=1 Tax=Actinophytocola xanthii TaxID=1912961 RepID=A0A1Q8CKY5_9PSEU|nr:AfsR/SARP family transcriptional regulator [Actinophytocola xanthii]OLF15015.1 hypothetical protein BU204_24270 [Actinophytocola xanthii]
MIDLGPAKQRTILAALLVNLEQPVPLDVLVDRVWDENPPVDVRNVVYTYVARLRRKLSCAAGDCADPPQLKRMFGGYCLQTAPDNVDLYRFRGLLERARKLESDADEQRSTLLREANGLWRGVPLAGVDGRWAAAMRHGLQQLRHEALVEWADVEIRLGRPRRVIDQLRQAVFDSPFSEPLVAHLMLALHADGRSAEALQVFEGTRRQLADDMGTDPAPSLQEVHRDILQGRASVNQQVEPEQEVAATPVQVTTVSRPGAQSVNLLPIDLPDFTGRGAEMSLLAEALTPSDTPLSPSVAVLYGPAGIGKTTLAVHASYRLRKYFPDGQLFADLDGTGLPPAEPTVVLERFLRALGTTDIPASFVERAELYRARLANARMLVVLDNAVDEPQVAPLLPGTGQCAVIVSCQVRPPVPAGVPVIRLAPMPVDEASAFLRQMIGPARMNADPQATRELLALCEGSPLVLRIIGGKLMTRQHWSVARLLNRLRDDDRLLGELTDGTHDVRMKIGRTFHALDHATQRLFLGLATSHLDDEFSVRSAARALQVNEHDAEESVERLLDCHLLGIASHPEAGDLRYVLPKLHRLYASTVCGEPVKIHA